MRASCIYADALQVWKPTSEQGYELLCESLWERTILGTIMGPLVYSKLLQTAPICSRGQHCSLRPQSEEDLVTY